MSSSAMIGPKSQLVDYLSIDQDKSPSLPAARSRRKQKQAREQWPFCRHPVCAERGVVMATKLM